MKNKASALGFLGTLAAFCLLILVGCGNAGGTSNTESRAEDRAAQRVGDELILQIWGSASQKDAAQFLTNYWLNAPVQKCMSGLGFDYPLPDPKDFPHAWTGYDPDGGSGSTWLSALWKRQVSEKLLALATGDPAEQAAAVQIEDGDINSDPDFGAALNSCEERRRFDDWQPREVEPLGAAYTRLVSGVDDDLGSADDYLACMKVAGYDLSAYDGSGFGALYGYLRDSSPVVDRAPADGEPGTAEWDDFIELEADALSADEGCRRDRYEAGWKQLTPLLEAFREEHETELAEVQRQWTKLEGQAAELGFTP